MGKIILTEDEKTIRGKRTVKGEPRQRFYDSEGRQEGDTETEKGSKLITFEVSYYEYRRIKSRANDDEKSLSAYVHDKLTDALNI